MSLGSSLPQSSYGSCGEHGCYVRLISVRCTAMHRTVLVKFSSVFFLSVRGIRFVSFGGQSSVPLECFSDRSRRLLRTHNFFFFFTQARPQSQVCSIVLLQRSSPALSCQHATIFARKMAALSVSVIQHDVWCTWHAILMKRSNRIRLRSSAWYTGRCALLY